MDSMGILVLRPFKKGGLFISHQEPSSFTGHSACNGLNQLLYTIYRITVQGLRCWFERTSLGPDFVSVEEQLPVLNDEYGHANP